MPQVNKWRLSKTLKRKTEFRPVEQDDIRYVWAAYKKGGLKELGLEEGIGPDEFKRRLAELIVSTCQMAWTLVANTKQGFIPCGIILCAWGPFGKHLVVMGIAWFPWATNRNVVECMVGFFSKFRKEYSFVGYALPEHKRMYEICCMHGIGRRVGTSYVMIPGKRCAVFETRNIDVIR